MTDAKNKRGSITLETAIALPLLLFVAFSLLQYPVAAQAGLLIRNAADNTAAETAMVVAASDAAGIDDGLQRVLEEAVGDPEAAGRLLDISAVLAGGPFIRERIIHWMTPGDRTDPCLKGVHDLDVRIEGALSDGEVYLHVSYRLDLLFGTRSASFDTLLPVAHSVSGSSVSADSDGVWSLDNLERGRVLRIRNGGNLPMGYPVIAAYREGTATSIRSMDVTAPGLQSEDSVFDALCEEIDLLSSFDGTDRPWGSGQIHIQPGDIRSRILFLVIPENPMGPVVRAEMERAAVYADCAGISLVVSAQGISNRYA